KKDSWGRRSNQRLAAAARQALAEIGEAPAPGAPTPDNAFPGTSATVSADRLITPQELPARIKCEVRDYVRQGNTKAAVKVLYDNVLALVDQRRFDEAQALRRALVAIDPLAFNAIVKSGARIDAARSAAIDSEHMAIWHEFYQGLTLSEANSFYYSLNERHFAPGEALITQGQSKACLYMINRGRVKSMFQRKGGAIQLNTLAAGDIGGYETFFHNTVATTSLIAAEPVTASCLDRRVLERAKERASHLSPKLHDFCLRRIKKSDLWLRKSVDRRTQRRVALMAPVKLRLPDAQGRGIDVAYRGQLVDISVGGAALRVRLSRGDRTRMLVGRPVLLELDAPLSQIVSPSRRDTVVVALRPRLLEEHFLQIQFVHKIKLDEFQRIEELMGSF
ncbi:MAG: cyclic nucleotide-binding domain-containing protein, partial [Desulfobacterales bacterium]